MRYFLTHTCVAGFAIVAGVFSASLLKDKSKSEQPVPIEQTVPADQPAAQNTGSFSMQSYQGHKYIIYKYGTDGVEVFHHPRCCDY